MEDNNRDYSNNEITVHWRPSYCVHATICFSELIEVFNPSKRPWVNMRGASSKKIMDIVKKCPTHALTYSNKDGSRSDKPPKDLIESTINLSSNIESKAQITKVQIMKDGPILISGKFIVLDINGNEMKNAEMVSLCRCGYTRNKPFCDGNHRKNGFYD